MDRHISVFERFTLTRYIYAQHQKRADSFEVFFLDGDVYVDIQGYRQMYRCKYIINKSTYVYAYIYIYIYIYISLGAPSNALKASKYSSSMAIRVNVYKYICRYIYCEM